MFSHLLLFIVFTVLTSVIVSILCDMRKESVSVSKQNCFFPPFLHMFCFTLTG